MLDRLADEQIAAYRIRDGERLFAELWRKRL
jgi:hypothetical protein